MWLMSGGLEDELDAWRVTHAIPLLAIPGVGVEG